MSTLFHFTYTNYKNETAIRHVTPVGLRFIEKSILGYQPGWFLDCVDHDRNGAARSFRIDEQHMKPEPEHEFKFGDLHAIQSAVERLQGQINEQTSPEIASLAGKYVGMDVDKLTHLMALTNGVEIAQDLIRLAASALTQAK